MALRVPIRQTGGLPVLGSITIPVEGNPVGDVNRPDPLIKLLIDKDIFEVSSGTPVVANPGGTGLLTLSTIGIDGVDFAVGAGMGGGGSDGVAESLSFTKAGNTITGAIGRSGGLTDVTGMFDVFSGDYNDLINPPTIPTLPNIDNVLTGQPVVSGQELSFMQHDGDTVSVTLPSGGGGGAPQVQTDWDAITGLGEILNKPDLSDVLTGISGITGNTLTFDQFDGGATSVSLPNDNDYVDSAGLAISGQDLTLTLGRTGTLADLAQTVTLPAGGGGGSATPTDPVVFTVHMGALASVSLTTSWQNVLSFIEAAVDINDGGFTFPEVSARRSIVFPSAGKYAVQGTLTVERASGGRTGFGVRVQHTRGSTITHYGESWGGYSRGSGDADLASTSFGFDLDIETGDSITIEASTTQSETGNVGGTGSRLSIHKIASLTGASVTTNRERVEGVVFNAVPSTTTELRIQTVSSSGVVVEFGDGPVEMLTAVAGANTFMIARAGVYMMEWVAVINPEEARPEPCLQILNNADNTLLGQIDPTYIRSPAAGVLPCAPRRSRRSFPKTTWLCGRLSRTAGRTTHSRLPAGINSTSFGGRWGRRAIPEREAEVAAAQETTPLIGPPLGDTSNVPDDKLPDTLLTGIDSFTYLDATRAIVLNFDRIDGSTNNGQIILPDFLDATEVWDWALASNSDRLPNSKLGLDVVIGITSVTYDTSTRNLRVRLPQADGGDTFAEATLPEFLAAADVADWAETGNTDDIPDSKLPGTLIDSISSFSYDVTSRILQLQLRRLNNATIAGNVTLPQFLAEAAVETWALTANPNEDIPAAKLPAHTVGLLPSFDPGSNVFSLARTTSVGSTITTTTTFPRVGGRGRPLRLGVHGEYRPPALREDSASPAVAGHVRLLRPREF